MNVVKALDERLLKWTQKWYKDLYGRPKILSLAAILLSIGLLRESTPENLFWWTSLSLFILSSLIFLYEKRVWYHLRKKGGKEAEGLFFEELAHPLRKWAFLASCIFPFSKRMFLPNYSAHSFIYGHGSNNYLIFTVIHMTFGSVFLAEILRLAMPSGSSWSDKKHFFTFLVISVLSTALQITVLYNQGILGSVMF